MICSYGMDDIIGMAVLSPDEALKSPFAEKIITRISEIIKEELDAAIQTISKNTDKIDLLVTALLEKNKLSKEEIENILK